MWGISSPTPYTHVSQVQLFFPTIFGITWSVFLSDFTRWTTLAKASKISNSLLSLTAFLRIAWNGMLIFLCYEEDILVSNFLIFFESPFWNDGSASPHRNHSKFHKVFSVSRNYMHTRWMLLENSRNLMYANKFFLFDFRKKMFVQIFWSLLKLINRTISQINRSLV